MIDEWAFGTGMIPASWLFSRRVVSSGGAAVEFPEDAAEVAWRRKSEFEGDFLYAQLALAYEHLCFAHLGGCDVLCGAHPERILYSALERRLRNARRLCQVFH